MNDNILISLPLTILPLAMSNDKTDKIDENCDPNKKINKQTLEEDYGYNFFKERSPLNSNEDGSHSKSSPGLKSRVSSIFSSVTDKIALVTAWKQLQHQKCEFNVLWCVQHGVRKCSGFIDEGIHVSHGIKKLRDDPLVKLMVGALKSHGCEVKLDRHFSCEPCTNKVNGGYDPLSNQVVVCENVTTKRHDVCSVLGHELTHAFDKCRTKLDFTNLEHLACTEIRASNFSHCSYAFAVANGNAKPWDYKEAHQLCVKNRAAQSVMMVRNVSADKAMEVVDKVFDKCYADLEPVGRIPRKQTRDAHLALVEGELYGYT